MSLTGEAIHAAIKSGDIKVDPFEPDNIGPNSLDLRLSDEFGWYVDEGGHPIDMNPMHYLDVKKKPKVKTVKVDPDKGFILTPKRGFLARTVEHVETLKYIPHLHGRSSVGRMFISVHQTAGWGDTGFGGTWTLELSCIHPVRIYPGMRICQVAFTPPVGPITSYADRSSSKYHGQREPTASRIYRDYEAD